MMRQFQATFDPANCVVNGVCNPGEDCISCAADCAQVSGAQCGNKLCEIGDGENFDNCPEDCAGKAKGGGAFACGDPNQDPRYVDCSDPRCTDGFFCRQTPRVLACCGDSLCEGAETGASCAVDCQPATAACSTYTDKASCSGDPACLWQNNTKTCVTR